MIKKRQKVRHHRASRKVLVKIAFLILPIVLGFIIFFIINFSYLWLPYLGFEKNTIIEKPIVKSNLNAELSQELASHNIEFDKIVQSTGSARLYTQIKDGPTVVFSDSKNADSQVSSLQLILRHLTIEQGKKAKLIDLRFNKPIVKF